MSTIGDLITGGIDDILKIKQLNRNATTTANKSLAPINPQARIGSGNRRQYSSQNYKKRYSSIEISSNDNNKYIVIHGAGLAKPSSSLHLNEDKPTIITSSASLVNNSSNSFLPLSSSTSNAGNHAHHNVSHHHQVASNIHNRSTNNSSQAFHHHLQANNPDENGFDNEYNDYQFNNFYDNQENSIDEINLLNLNGGGGSSIVNSVTSNKLYYYNGHYGASHLGGGHLYHNHYNGNHPYQQLPPIENSLTLKPIRISSANNLKQIKEKNERPMTSAATRVRRGFFNYRDFINNLNFKPIVTFFQT